jgi:hypothetical protein
MPAFHNAAGGATPYLKSAKMLLAAAKKHSTKLGTKPTNQIETQIGAKYNNVKENSFPILKLNNAIAANNKSDMMAAKHFFAAFILTIA